MQMRGAADDSGRHSAEAVDGTPAWLLTAAWTGMGVVLWVMFPMTSTVLLPLCCIAPLAWYWMARRRFSRVRPGRKCHFNSLLGRRGLAALGSSPQEDVGEHRRE